MSPVFYLKRKPKHNKKMRTVSTKSHKAWHSEARSHRRSYSPSTDISSFKMHGFLLRSTHFLRAPCDTLDTIRHSQAMHYSKSSLIRTSRGL
uniref:Uncharacterized protein n=1 Tax=Rhipicephalus zambeziensis TaxID=60191 RepID=A0A224YFJ6_9ACAR